jgi:hypothetical protein
MRCSCFTATGRSSPPLDVDSVLAVFVRGGGEDGPARNCTLHASTVEKHLFHLTRTRVHDKPESDAAAMCGYERQFLLAVMVRKPALDAALALCCFRLPVSKLFDLNCAECVPLESLQCDAERVGRQCAPLQRVLGSW